MKNHEKTETNSESIKSPEALSEAAHEQREAIGEKLNQKAEKAGEDSRESVEDATKEALEKATSKETVAKKEHVTKERRKDGPASKAERSASYKRTMKHVESELSAPSRVFSRFIHNKAIERTSEVVGSTIARPNAILTGSIFAFLFTLALLLLARHYGYALSGSETMAMFAIGWAAGLLFDYIRLMATGKRS